MIYGYCRISTKKQSIERQIRNIKAAYPEADIYDEAYCGSTTARPKFEMLIKRLHEGDTVVFDSVSRMSRNAEDGFDLYEKLYKRGVNLIFLKEPHINTEVYRTAQSASVPLTGTAVDCILDGVNKYLFVLAKEQIRLAFEQSEKEVVDLRQRTKEGLMTARNNGKKLGGKVGAKYSVKKEAEAKEIIKKHSKEFGGNLSDAECIKLCGISRNTYYRYKKDLKEQG